MQNVELRHEEQRAIANNDTLNPLVPGSLRSRCKDVEDIFVWILATKNGALGDGSDFYTSFTQLVSNRCTWAGEFRWRLRGAFPEIASCDNNVIFRRHFH